RATVCHPLSLRLGERVIRPRFGISEKPAAPSDPLIVWCLIQPLPDSVENVGSIHFCFFHGFMLIEHCARNSLRNLKQPVRTHVLPGRKIPNTGNEGVGLVGGFYPTSGNL